MLSKFNGDNFLFGLFAGLATLLVSYLTFRFVRASLAEHYGNPYFFPAPRIELLAILVNILFFRVMMVNLKREKTGRGILFGTVILAMIFFFLFFKYNYRLP
jgi:hypothetical protein